MVSVERFVFLVPEYVSYRIPVFERLHNIFGNGFNIVTLAKSCLVDNRAKLALEKGDFPKHQVPGIVIAFDKAFKQGKGTPSRILINPSLPFILIQLKPQIVMSEGFSVWTLTSILMGYPTIIFWEGGNEFTERTVKPWKVLLRKWMVKRVHAFVTNGHLSKKYLVEKLNAPEEKVLVGGMCSQPATVDLSSQIDFRDLNPDCVNFVFCGSLISRKGVQHLLKAVSILKHGRKLEREFSVLLLGDGKERKEFEKIAEDLKIEDVTQFLGFVDPEVTWSYYAKSHVFILPTLHDNWPLVVPEAMFMKLPVLVSKYAGNVPDLVRDGENGYVFDPEDHSLLSSLMAKYINDRALIQEHGEKSLEIVTPFNPDTAAGKILTAIRIADKEASASDKNFI